MSKDSPTPLEAQKKLEHYCAYQDRCHQEVSEKLRSLGMDTETSDRIIVHLINHNFLSEERFARSFARGKHRIKHWGKIRIVRELKARSISQYNINAALKEIDPDEYAGNFEALADRFWLGLQESNSLKKQKKTFDFLYRKGFETDLIQEKLNQLKQNNLS